MIQGEVLFNTKYIFENLINTYTFIVSFKEEENEENYKGLRNLQVTCIHPNS